MTEIVIVDDERHCSDLLAELLKAISTDYHIKAVFNSPVKALQYIQENKLDLLFLDIAMPGMNGFTLLNKAQPVDFDIIFTTAFDQYAIKAFQYSAISYLLKPIAEKDIVVAMRSWEQRKKKMYPEQLEILKNHIDEEEGEKNKLALPTRKGYDIVEIKNLIRCQSDNNYTYFYFSNENSILVSRTLKEIESILLDTSFLRVHQSHLINPEFVRGISKGGKSMILILKDGTEIPVSRQKRKYVKDILNATFHFD